MNSPSPFPIPRSVKIKWNIMVPEHSALDSLCNLKNKKRYLTFKFYMKIYTYCLYKSNNTNKAQSIFLVGGDLRMRCAHKKWDKWDFCAWTDQSPYALTWPFSSVSVSARSRAPGPWKSRLHLCPTCPGALWFMWLCRDCFYASQKLIFFAFYCELAFGLSTGIVSPWNLSASFLSLRAIYCRVCSLCRWAATGSLTGSAAAQVQTQRMHSHPQ